MVNEKILIVEDEGIVAMHIQNSLKTLGYNVVGIASSGEEAIEMAKKYRPDMVLMDIVLKGMIDGIEAADQIRNNFNIPAVFLTAYGDESTLNRAKITEPFGYLLKPFKERDLHIAIEIAIYKHRIESRLKAIDRFLSTILKSIGDAIITTDTKGLITFSNSAAGVMTGWDMEEAVNKNITDVFNIANERTHVPFENLAAGIIRDGVDLDLPPDTILISRDGKELPIEGRGAPMMDEKGEIEGMIFSFRDTGRRKVEKELNKHR